MESTLVCVLLVVQMSMVFGETTLPPVNKDCLLPTTPGMCKGFFPRFSFRSDTKTCKQFIFGGCGGNGNNFLFEDECNKNCVHAQSSTNMNSICSLPTVVGPCDAAFNRFSYHPDTNKCTQFSYGGCQGNQNNFHSEKECNQKCVN